MSDPNTGKFVARLLLAFLLGLPWVGYSFGSGPAQPKGSQQDHGSISVDPASRRMTIDYTDAELTTVLKAIAYSFNLNVVMAKDVQGKVSANLSDVTIDDALSAILEVNGYKFIRKNDIIYVSLSGEIETAVQTFQLSFLMAEDAKQILGKVISKHGDIQTNEATNSLVVVDTPEGLERIRGILKDMDVAPVQVLIEAKVVDIQSQAYENIGTTISTSYDPKGSGTGGGVFNRSTLAGESISVETDLNGPSTDVDGDQITIKPTFKSLSLDVKVDALIQDNRAHVLASPSIATLNGKEAKIIIGERFPYLETTQTSSGNTQTTRFVDVGTALKVTPMVSPDGWITMKVHPEVSSVSASLSAGPRITTREAQATIRVRDSETIIIGGLINKKDDRVKAGVPFLRSIPGLRWLFSKRSSSREDTELVVFITPRIIRSSSKHARPEHAHPGIDYIEGGDRFTQEYLLSYIEHLESRIDRGHPKTDDLFLQSEMLNAYQMIYRQFPSSPKADHCLFKMAEIYAKVFGKNEAALQSLDDLAREFPKSPVMSEARRLRETLTAQRSVSDQK